MENPVNINPNVRRRRAGLVFLGLAGVMLVLGLTLFGKSLRGVGFLAYWLGCLALTLTAMLLAVREMRDIRRQNREEKIGLFEKAFDEVAAEVKEARDRRRANRGK
jgi:uncharacterized membrane protein YhaH (DUF805 family)